MNGNRSGSGMAKTRTSNGIDVRLTTLEGGLRVISQHMPGFATCSAGVWVGAGARNESATLNGISHLIEHMAFKGTERRDAYAIAAEIEAVGGHLNAYTSREHTAFYAKVLKDDLPLALDILGDILCHSTFADDELAREKEVVIQEIGQAHDTPDDIVFDYFQETAYPEQSIGRPVLGSADGVSQLTRDQLFEYMASHYTAPDMVLAAAGHVDHERLVALVGEAFATLPALSGPTFDKARYLGGEFRSDRALEQLHLLIGLDGFAYQDDDFYALQVLSTLLGGGMSSRLFQEVREKRGLAYSVYSFAGSYVDGGLFGIYAGAAPEDAAELAGVLCDETRKVADGVSDEEVARARAQLKSGLLMSLESSYTRCETLARQLLIYGRAKTIEEMVAEIDAVGPEHVRGCMTRLLGTAAPTVTALGPVGTLPDYPTVAGRLH